MAALDPVLLPTPEGFLCPITHEIMRDPVCTADGQTYEREAITHWFQVNRRGTSPVTGAVLAARSLTPNYALRRAIEAYLESRPELVRKKMEEVNIAEAVKIRESDLAEVAQKSEARAEYVKKLEQENARLRSRMGLETQGDAATQDVISSGVGEETREAVRRSLSFSPLRDTHITEMRCLCSARDLLRLLAEGEDTISFIAVSLHAKAMEEASDTFSVAAVVRVCDHIRYFAGLELECSSLVSQLLNICRERLRKFICEQVRQPANASLEGLELSLGQRALFLVNLKLMGQLFLRCFLSVSDMKRVIMDLLRMQSNVGTESPYWMPEGVAVAEQESPSSAIELPEEIELMAACELLKDIGFTLEYLTPYMGAGGIPRWLRRTDPERHFSIFGIFFARLNRLRNCQGSRYSERCLIMIDDLHKLRANQWRKLPVVRSMPELDSEDYAGAPPASTMYASTLNLLRDLTM
ncbi:unnamed protein product [Amoebophrya sp. A120]|nr:unnamed protein product [Amoebophrya sp. A120]|eukprot:GSA120T00009424001.1